MNLTQSMSSNKILTNNLNTQKLINSALEKRIITKTATLITLYEGARKLESIDIEEIYSAILDFFTKTLNLEQAAIYKRSEQGWHLTKQHGWPENTSWPHDYPFGTGRLVAMVGASKKIMSIRDIITTSPQDTALKKQLSELNLQNECLMAGPLRNGENGEVEAVFAIQAMKLLDLNSATINLFTFLLSWANRAIARAHYFMQLEDQEIIDPRYNVYSYRYFEARLQQEFLRAKTYYLPLSLMLIHVPGLGEMNAEKHKVLLTSISQVLKNHCRGTDIISLYHENDIPFACLLTTTAQSKAEELKSTILNNFNELGLSDHAKLIVGTSHFTPAVNSLQNIIELAKKDLTNAA